MLECGVSDLIGKFILYFSMPKDYYCRNGVCVGSCAKYSNDEITTTFKVSFCKNRFVVLVNRMSSIQEKRFNYLN